MTRRGSRRGQLSDLHVFRYVPADSPVHRSWAGTKICAIVVLTLGLLLWPTWAAGGLALVVVLVGALVSRIPRGVAPRVPLWIWLFLLVGAVIALLAGGGELVVLGPLRLRVGGLDEWARFSLIALDLLLFAALMSWTTQLADLAPALGRLGRPLRRLGVPVDEIVGAIALAIRCLPLLLEETRMLLAARRTRLPETPRSWKDRSLAAEQLFMAGLQSSLRRARELAEAIEARGGKMSSLGETHELGLADLFTVALVLATTAGMALLR